MSAGFEDASLRLAFGALSPHTVDRLISANGSVSGAVRAIDGGRTTVGDAARSAVLVDVAERRRQLSEAEVTFLTRDGSGYPTKLAQYEGAPRWLFVHGDAGLVNEPKGPSIAIVGSRSATAYGLGLAERYGFVAAEGGWHVVSGLARGIDAAAHRGALSVPSQNAGRCIGVLGSGIDIVYPKGNRDLYQQVPAAGGALVSEFPLGTRPDGWRFPTRNRIIAGLADVVLVVEASQSGGALITARIALDYGVPVYAVPGDVDRETSGGTNELIRDGAFPIFGPEDLETVLGLLAPLVSGSR